ncbi:MAG: glycosyltransferase family 2 protein [Deltaproteobacteria bacterium]|nr:glycosyltransferase family 2 protein [Deltaproteobacteria bacterium]MBK8237635.1 glycosyltransferase family 2 protein [Deltaproteobacteria bacterium]MBK8719491.1 glycosyltransferase family 2 protein [Deltaproteobacteria bacterium]MBP7287550.1 glycosyltransferase family 2 protein [Nannocystaceae bacterium]
MTDLVPITNADASITTTGAFMHEHAGVSIVIPAYNEERGAGPVIEEMLALLRRELANIPWEVLIVDDGSSDRTAEVIAKYESDELRLIRHPHNRGYGAAIKTGVNAAAHPWILITDADGTYPAKHIPELLSHRRNFHMVVGARTGPKAAVAMLRRPPKYVLRKLASYLSRQDIPDLNSGLRLMRKDILQRFENILPDQFSYTTTITLAMFSAGFHVKYLQIDYLKREGKSKIRPIADTIGFTKLIFRTILYFDPLRVFIPAAGLFIIASLLVASISAMSGQLMDVTTVLLFTTGFQLLMMGMLADMLNRRLP